MCRPFEERLLERLEEAPPPDAPRSGEWRVVFATGLFVGIAIATCAPALAQKIPPTEGTKKWRTP